MKYAVHMTSASMLDLLGIQDYVARNDSLAKSIRLMDQIEAAVASLEYQPKRGRIVPEADILGYSMYREIFFKSYRIAYQVQEKDVYVVGVFDGRRDIRELLARRLTQH